MSEESDEEPDTLNDILVLAMDFLEEAYDAQHDEVRLGAYLSVASRCLSTVLDIYAGRLAQKCAEAKQGEAVK